ncbi:transmembrane protein 25 isoform X2 [Paroedura picta]|uniref:transmembrane protein 25 isoform X2 n=1 Tax=Paroedura picta TaxID=143630 RepID=UPI001013F125
MTPLLLLLLLSPLGRPGGGRGRLAQFRPAGSRSAGSAPLPFRTGAPEPEAESGASSCLAAAPSLAWYLDGDTDGSGTPEPATEGAFQEAGSSGVTFVVRPRHLDRLLNCSTVDPASGHVSRTSVALHVQFQPELVQVEAHSDHSQPPSLLLVLFVLVQAQPPASITWVDLDGRLMINTSHFLIVDTKTYPWMANHTLEVQLRSWTHNQAGILNTSILLPGFLDTHVELPLLALVVSAAVSLGLLTGLAALSSYVGYQKGKKAAGLTLPIQLSPSDLDILKLPGPRLLRANMSLPSNLQLNDFSLEPRVIGAEGVQDEEGPLSEPENSLVLANRGLSHFPMVGYIYRASSSGTSEEIWL